MRVHWVVFELPFRGGQTPGRCQRVQDSGSATHYDASRPAEYVSTLRVGSATETVEIVARP